MAKPNTNEPKAVGDDGKNEALDALRLQAIDLGQKLGQPIASENIEAMGSEQLAEVVEGFKARLATQQKPASDGGATVPSVVASGARYLVAPGKSISCKRGILAPGDEIVAADVQNGREQLEFLASRGHLVKR